MSSWHPSHIIREMLEKYSLGELSTRLQIAKTSIAGYKDKTREPSVESLYKIATFYKLFKNMNGCLFISLSVDDLVRQMLQAQFDDRIDKAIANYKASTRKRGKI